jgi:serine phosphatase RsbU (regulator of sigma subunit)
MTDAMGHTLDAALLATRARRRAAKRAASGCRLAEQAGLAHRALAAYATHGGFVTGQLVRVDLPSGTARIVNAGHPPPLRIRAGKAEEINSHHPPFAFAPRGDYQVQDLALEAGDRLLFVTDGILERNASNVDVLSLITASRHLRAREAVQELTRAVVSACGGELRDDATVLCFDSHGGPPRDRDSSSGTDR